MFFSVGAQYMVPIFLSNLIILSAFAHPCFAGGVQASHSHASKKSLSTVQALIVDVNGERRQVAAKDQLTIVDGDLFVLVGAVVSSSDQGFTIDLIGYEDLKASANNDQGKLIDSAEVINGGVRSKDGSRVNRIKIRGNHVQTVEIPIVIVEPQLLFFDIEINGERMRLTDKQRLSLAATDQIKVLDIGTNVRGNENVKHDLVTKSRADGALRKEIRFSRGRKIFARIPIDWKGS